MLQTTDPKDIAFPGLADRYRRTTHVLDEALRRIGLALGGRPGARLASRLGGGDVTMALLRLIDALPVAEPTVARVVGLDDFALRRGHERP